jgi:hypothetical protein
MVGTIGDLSIQFVTNHTATFLSALPVPSHNIKRGSSEEACLSGYASNLGIQFEFPF